MWRKVRFTFLMRLGLYVATIIVSTSAETGTAEQNEYRNVDYAYAVSLPGDLHYEMNKAPNPNHGFRINVAPSATVWVDASYTDDSTLTRAVDSERAMWEKSCKTTNTEAKKLGGARAVQITLKCASEPGGTGPTTVTLLVALASPPDRGRIRYEIGMQYTFGAASSVQTQHAVKTVQAGFHFIRP